MATGALRKSVLNKIIPPSSAWTKSTTKTLCTYTGGFDIFNQGRRILVTGGTGQIGMELVPHLRSVYGKNAVINSDIKMNAQAAQDGPFVYCDVLSQDSLARLVLENGIDTIIHNASLLSAIGEKNPSLALKVNTRGIENVLEVAKANNLKVFTPSTIAVFGPSTPKIMTPDHTLMRPTTVYGITKVHMELLGEYYHAKFGLDFRSIRYPGVISAEAWPGGGTTDYAVEIFYEALRTGTYTSYIAADTRLPMMYMDDCIKATMELLEVPSETLTQRVYNVTAFSFTPAELALAIQKIMPTFKMSYATDFRQEIAATWPESIDDSLARRDWQWQPTFELDDMVRDMLTRLKKKLVATQTIPA